MKTDDAYRQQIKDSSSSFYASTEIFFFACLTMAKNGNWCFSYHLFRLTTGLTVT